MRQAGVTLIELIAVMVALTAGIAVIGMAYVAPASSIANNTNMQAAWQAVEACADYAVGLRRISGSTGSFSNITVGMADPCPAVNGITPSFVVSDTSGAGACAGLAGASTCRLVFISATSGGYTASTNVVVANY